MTIRDLFDRCKLQLDRLNNMWSPSGERFCYRTQSHLDRAVWNDRTPRRSIEALQDADRAIRARYWEWNNDVSDSRMNEWNRIYGAVQGMLSSLVEYR